MSKKLSIIIRTKNEERWISSCLESVFSQKYKDFEVIIVDNNSTDKTLEKVKRYNNIKIVTIDEYLPGKALNVGINASTGMYIVCLSGHCIPVNNLWLGNLVRNIRSRDVAGVYGRQQPLSYSSDFDKRDLLITFGLDRKVQVKDSFFHNANSILKRSVWKETPFDDEVTNIEDRIWAREVMKRGYKIIYEPSASVYHYHGIHQNGNLERCQNIVKILEKLESHDMRSSVDPRKITVISAIPIKNGTQSLGNRPLLEYTLQRSRESRYIKYSVVAAEDEETLSLARTLGADFCFKRPPDLSRDYIDVQDILRFCVYELEKVGVIPDVVVYLSANCPFREKGFIDRMIEQLANGGCDSILPAIREYKSCWINESGTMKRVDEGFMPSKMKHPLHIGISGLGTATFGDIIRHGDRLGHKIGMIEIDDITQTIDVGKQGGRQLAELIIEKWWEQN